MLDHYFDGLEVEAVSRDSGWRRIDSCRISFRNSQKADCLPRLTPPGTVAALRMLVRGNRRSRP